MAVEAYLNFQGNCREAVLFYAEVFGQQEPYIMTFGETPQDPNHPLPEAARDLVMHARLNILGSRVMFSDVFPGMPYTLGNHISLSLISRDQDALKDAYHKLKEGGQVMMELQETFWSPLYGSLTDRFGITWQFNYDVEQEQS